MNIYICARLGLYGICNFVLWIFNWHHNAYWWNHFLIDGLMISTFNDLIYFFTYKQLCDEHPFAQNHIYILDILGGGLQEHGTWCILKFFCKCSSLSWCMKHRQQSCFRLEHGPSVCLLSEVKLAFKNTHTQRSKSNILKTCLVFRKDWIYS